MNKLAAISLAAVASLTGQAQAFCDFKEVKWTYYSNTDCKDVDVDASEMAQSAYSEVINQMNNCYEVDGYHLKAECDSKNLKINFYKTEDCDGDEGETIRIYNYEWNKCMEDPATGFTVMVTEASIVKSALAALALALTA